VRKNLVHMF
jgi:hypothetical protein